METITATINWRGDWDACIPGGCVTLDLATDNLDDDDFREHARKTLRDLYSELVGEPVNVTFSDEYIDDEIGTVRRASSEAEKPAHSGGNES